MNNLISLLKESATVKLADEVRFKKASGANIIELQTGDPDFDTPVEIKEAAIKALKDGRTHYSFSKGEPDLRNAIANKLAKENGIHADPNKEIAITAGGIHAYFCALSAILNPGDEVIIPGPSWMSHYNVAKYLGAKVIEVNEHKKDDFLVPIEAFSAKISPKTKAIIINFPSNPTGVVADKDYLLKLLNLADEHNLFIISDEVYEYIIFDGVKHQSIGSLENKPQRIITINSFSKSYAMTGWRIGYIVASPEIINLTTKILQSTVTNLPPFIQAAAVEALTSNIVLEKVKQMVKSYESRRNNVMEFAKNALPKVIFNKPAGAFYFFIDIGMLGIDSNNASRQLIEKNNLALVPGIVFGSSGGNYLRMTIAASDTTITNGLNAIKEWLDKI